MNMIEGVVVLNKIAEYKEVSETIYALVILAVAVGASAIMIGLFDMDDGYSYSCGLIKLIVGIILLILGTIGLVYAKTIGEKPTGKYQYQVTIDNSVTMSEFYDKYEVIEVEGKIYTIREKDGE